MIRSLSVFFPAFNEQGSIEKVVRKAVKFLQLQIFPWEIIIIDDGSTDETGKITDQLEKQYQKVRTIHQENGGYGVALKTGFNAAKFDWIVYLDSDGQFDITDMSKFLDKAKFCDAIWGFRIKRQDSLFRKLSGLTWAFSVRLLYGIKLFDTNCGFKMIKRSAIKSILPLTSTRGAMINVELAVKLKKQGFRICEIGVRHFPRKNGNPTGASLSVILQSYLELLKLRFAQ